MTEDLKQRIAFDKNSFYKKFIKEDADGRISFKKNVIGAKIKLFPFITKDTDATKSVNDFRDFQGVTGACYRVLRNVDLPKVKDEELDKLKKKSISKKEVRQTNIIKRAIEEVDEISDDDIQDLEDILRHTIFDSNYNLNVFEKNIFAHQQFHYPNNTLEDFAKFIVDLFLQNEHLAECQIKEKLIEVTDSSKTNDNLLYKLIRKALPDLPEKKSKIEKNYYCHLTNLFDVFAKDFAFIAKNEESLIEHFTDLIKYYFFYYISRFSCALNSFFNVSEDDERTEYKLYFSLDREKLSKYRLAYTQGWFFLEKKIKNLFSHACCLEYLGYINTNSFPMSYGDIQKWIKNLSEEELQAYSDSVAELLETYKKSILGLGFNGDWESFDNNLNDNSYYQKLEKQPVFQKIYAFWNAIDHQFLKSPRFRAYKGYSNWFEVFCRENFLKRRGRAGYTLVLNQDKLLFFTKLCVGENKKIRLKDFWGELERRGIYFDQKTKEEVVTLFEKINLLEKKSDSGDAQYVKSHF